MSDVGGFGGGTGGGGGGSSDARPSDESSQQQQQQHVMTVKLDIEARQSSDLLTRLQPFLSQQRQTGGSAGEEGGVELNLGLSLGSGSPVRKATKGGEFLHQEQQHKGEFLRGGWSGAENAEEQSQVQLRQPRNAAAAVQQQQQDAGREHAAKLQRRQEARKKRRILIDECRRSGPPRPGLGSHRRCRPPASPPPRLAAGEELKPPPPPPPPPLDTAPDSVEDAAALRARPAVRVKLENVEASAESSKVIRPSPIHESKEWVHKFLEMQRAGRSSEPSTSYEADQESQSRWRTGASPSSSLESPPFPGFDVKSPGNSARRRLLSTSSRDCSRSSLGSSSLFRSTSLGSSFASFKSDPPTQQEPSSVVTRTDSSSGVLLRTLSEGSKLERELSFGSPAPTQQQQQQEQQHQPNLPKLSAFKSPKKEPVDEDPGTSRPRNSMKRSNSVCFGIGGQAAAAATAQAATADGAGMFRQLPLVSTTGTGPDGKTVSGVLFAYRKGDVKIICACHGRHMTAREFVEHAGGVNVTHPEKCIVVNPSMLTRSRSMINNMPSTPAPPSSA